MTGDELSLGAGGDKAYNGPQSLLSSISTQVATSGVMLSIPPPFYSTNLSYTTTYYGPALNCAEIPCNQYSREVESVLTYGQVGCNISALVGVSACPDETPTYFWVDPTGSSESPFSAKDSKLAVHTGPGSNVGHPLSFNIARNC
jgi:hypothetical protein